MIKCPMCREMLPDETRICRKCQTDLSLLSDYTGHLRQGLSQADAATRAGELGDAVWAYLAVLEVDPDNQTARRQVGQVVTAVRQFDHTAPGRRWAKAVHKEGRYRRWLASIDEGEGGVAGFFGWVLAIVLVTFAVFGAYYLGYTNGRIAASKEPDKTEEIKKDDKKDDPKKEPVDKVKGLGGK